MSDDAQLDKVAALAQLRANATRQPFGVWVHVGDYGRRGGDQPARGVYRVQPLVCDMPSDWACIGRVDPEPDGGAA